MFKYVCRLICYNNQNYVCTKNNFCYQLIPMKIRKIKKKNLKKDNFYMVWKEVC
jgi:hypothetical protein